MECRDRSPVAEQELHLSSPKSYYAATPRHIIEGQAADGHNWVQEPDLPQPADVDYTYSASSPTREPKSPVFNTGNPESSPSDEGIPQPQHHRQLQSKPPTSKHWKLHSIILSKASTKLAELFKRYAPLKITKSDAKNGIGYKYKIELAPETKARNLDPQGLKFLSFHRINTAKYKQPLFMRNYNGLRDKVEFNRLYDNLFRCI
ncbi:uncharacterized protein L3040_008170 [Drepanopeziza brunnea f. sp. 'multigermtubi']|uniref:uncharacterized protein n=1 Tax=Drepanopeziza brunnea f. sp. 'multigermtubi' TaxID=698441 RepID=UPI0023A4F3E4|nr:hypothetical protein L3040_008170 [Drepanopeziza brunnea f. sp. 'multigermtubi']